MEYTTEKKIYEQINKNKKSKKLNKIWHSWVTLQHHSETEILSDLIYFDLNLSMSKCSKFQTKTSSSSRILIHG